MKSLYHLKREIEFLDEKIAELETKTTKITSVITDMPKARDNGDKLCADVVKLFTLKERRCKKEELYNQELEHTLDALKALEDSQLFIIFYNRLVEFKDWEEIAGILGGKNTYDNVRHMYYRNVKKLVQNGTENNTMAQSNMI
ncbi:hypothetical protein AGMMS49975_24220 [Clostridia bacterium]|nr:hypothetical protein AGMMS49975_24220 [Clostridia bacterium]